MKKAWLALCIGFLVAACGSSERSDEWNQWKVDNGKIKALSTIAMISDLVKIIGDEHVDSLTLIKGELDPHSYQLVKGDDEKFAAAQVIFFNGLGLEHGPSLQHQLYNNPRAVPLGDLIKQKYPERILSLKGQLDPHIWMDISLWSENIPIIVKELSEKDPAHADEFRRNGERLAKEFDDEHRQIQEIMRGIDQSHLYLVTSHDAFNYFTKAYLATDDERASGQWQERFAAPEGLAPESQLSATDIQEIIDHLEKYRIHVVFPESNVSKDSIRKIVQAAKEKGLNVQIADIPLYADAMGRPGSDGDTYLKMIGHNAKTIAHFLSQEKNHHEP